MNRGVVPFWPQGHDLNKLGRGPPGDAQNQISNRRFSVLQHISLCNKRDPGVGPFLAPGVGFDLTW